MIAIMSTWRSIFDSAPTRDLAVGEVLFRREEPVRFVHVVRTGTVALERPLADGTALTLHVAQEGSILAEASLFADAYHCDAVARDAARIASVARSDFLAGLEGNPGAALDLLRDASREVQAARARIEIMRLRRVADRLDAWLELNGEPPRGEWVRVADAIGVTQPALYRELSKRRRWSFRQRADGEDPRSDPTGLS